MYDAKKVVDMVIINSELKAKNIGCVGEEYKKIVTNLCSDMHINILKHRRGK